MPRYIVLLKDQYLEWSTIVDAPVTYGMTESAMRAYLIGQYGEQSNTDERMERTKRTGTSALTGVTRDELIGWNRAGENEESLTQDDLYRVYCIERK